MTRHNDNAPARRRVSQHETVRMEIDVTIPSHGQDRAVILSEVGATLYSRFDADRVDITEVQP